MLKNIINKKQQEIFINSEKPKDYFLSKKGGGKTYALCHILLNDIKTSKESKKIMLCSFDVKSIRSLIRDFECISVDFINNICHYPQEKYIITTNKNVSHAIICFTYDDVLDGSLKGYDLNSFDLVLRDNLEKYYSESLVKKMKEIESVIDNKNKRLLIQKNKNMEIPELLNYPTFDSIDCFNLVDRFFKKTRDTYNN